jgi:hypothetical protein
MAVAELELDLKWNKNSDAKLKNFMSRVNSETEFD